MSDLVRAELIKTLTTRLWWGMLIGVVLLTALQSVVGALVAGLGAGPDVPASAGLDEPSTVLAVYAQAPLSGTYLFALVMGVTAMTGEYRYQTITPTFLATPRRWRVVAAKALAQLGIGAGFGVVAVLTALVGAGIVMVVRGFSLAYDTPGLWRAIALAIMAIALWTLLGMGVGTLVRNQVAAILLALGLAIVVEPILGVALVALGWDGVAAYLPGAAAAAMASSTAGEGMLPWWGGGLTMIGYAGLFSALGILLSVRRDIT